ncbi:MAG: HupE/UreJ family protein [Gammaproteobacteria bacterium]|nr:HupE/UreJ family protein [Gammaproteobacteria bacterium]MDH5513095.1 HupE/UreJ family protein [Gammaproteobacteria bacterium]
MRRGYQILMAMALLLMAHASQAHTFGAHGAGLAAGLAHPFLGLDHLLAMLALGIWAVAQGGRAVWFVPAVFLGIMMIGALLAWGEITVPLIEAGIIGSVLILGWLIGFPVRLSLAVCVGLAGVLALFHGYSHGMEMPQAASAIQYGLGFLVSSGLLLLAGVRFGRWIMFRGWQVWLRPGGITLVATAVVMSAGS